jgi:hypothetical protein
MYCQDCAPTVAQKTGVDIVLPAREVSAGGIGLSIKSNPGNAGVADTTAAVPLNRRPDTRLFPTAVKVALGENEQGIIFGKVSNGFALLKSAGRNGYDETGLAIVPSVQATGIKNGAIECREDPSRWGIVHTPSGRMVSGREVDGQLVDGWPFKNPEEAAYIGGVLSGQDWARDLEDIPPAQVAQKEAIMDRYNEITADQQRIERHDPLKKARARRVGSASSSRSIPVSRRLPGDVSVEGALVKDPQYGGIARVVADDISEGGNLLFLVDSTGHRYEISRDEARIPTELDFETYKVAMPLDPSGESQPSCAGCQRPPGNDKVWYKMGRQTYCSACAPDVAIEKDFLMPEEIHNDMPEMFPGDRF